MLGARSGLRKRLAKVEKHLADRARHAELANCVCREMTTAWTHEEFEAEMNQTCPVHGFRRLGIIHSISFVNPDRTLTEDSLKLEQVIETYKLRLAQHSQSGIETEHDSQEP
jgi:hypothetical protein